MIVLERSGHGDQVIGHRDDREEQDKQKRESYQSTPCEPGMAVPHLTRPEDDEKQRDGYPQEIEKKLHAGSSIEQGAWQVREDRLAWAARACPLKRKALPQAYMAGG